MLYLKCTGVVQKALGLPKTVLADAIPSSAPLGNWYVHRFDTGRRKAYVFMSATTLFSFILFQGKKPVTAETLPNMMLGGAGAASPNAWNGRRSHRAGNAAVPRRCVCKTDSRPDLVRSTTWCSGTNG